MKVVDRIDTNKQVEQLTEEQRDDLFTQMIMGKDVTEEVETSKGRFVIKYPKNADHLTIGKISAARRNYKPIESFNVETEMINIMASTLDVMVVSGPKWFMDAKKLNSNFSFLEVPSRAFLSELYVKAHSFRDEVEQRLDKGEEPSSKRVPSAKSADDPVDGGAFGNLTNEPGNPES
jgi:hypothetical protein